MFDTNLKDQIINVLQNDNQALTLKNENLHYVLDYSSSSINKKINIVLEVNKSVTIFIYILCNASQKEYEIRCEHKQGSQCNIIIKTLVNNRGTVKLNISNIVNQNISYCKINQDIQGITFDNDSKIVVTPSILASNNKIVANHAVNIGNVNPDALFYLRSRGLSKSEATIKLIQSMFEDLHIESYKIHLNAYNNILQHVDKLFKINYEKY